MKKLFIILAAVAMVFVACKKENPTNNNHGWGAETLTFMVNNSTDIIMKKVEGGYIPDFHSRYFTEDFPFGLAFVHQLMHKHSIAAPTIDDICEWGIQQLTR